MEAFRTKTMNVTIFKAAIANPCFIIKIKYFLTTNRAEWAEIVSEIFLTVTFYMTFHTIITGITNAIEAAHFVTSLAWYKLRNVNVGIIIPAYFTIIPCIRTHLKPHKG